MDRDNKTVVAKAFGMEDGLLGDVDGVFGYEREFISRGVTISGRIYCIIRCTAGSTTHTHEGLKIFDETWLLSFE